MMRRFALAEELGYLSNARLQTLIVALLAWLRGKTPLQLMNLLDMVPDATQDDLDLLLNVADEKNDAGEPDADVLLEQIRSKLR